MHINFKKHDRATDPNNMNPSNFILSSKSSLSHLSTNRSSTTEEILDFTEPPMLPPIDFIEPPIPLPTPEKGNS